MTIRKRVELLQFTREKTKDVVFVNDDGFVRDKFDFEDDEFYQLWKQN